jgi:TetR/AcrR family fatty acid metabolism transcriptional regulator
MARARGGALVSTRRDGAADKRRVILDAAITVFAREGFHHCRVSDIAREANVAYGLVYHYFRSKDQVLDTLFTERWSLLLEAIAEADRSEAPVRERLRSIAGFIIESYRNDPDLMKVIIVEVTRAANTFGRAHLAEIRQAYDGIAAIVARGQADGTFRSDLSPEFATLCFYGAIEQLLTAWIFGELPRNDGEFEQAKHVLVETICDGLAVRSGVSA